MREILFRGKRVDNGEWVEGSLITKVFTRCGQDAFYILCPQEAVYDNFEDFSEENGIFEVAPRTVGQYTGITDRCGKKVFENDIVEVDGREGCFIVSWEGDEAQFFMDNPTARLGFFEMLHDLWVVGNIFDNPDLADW